MFLGQILAQAPTTITLALSQPDMLTWAGYVMTAIALPLAIRGGVGVAGRIGKVVAGFLR